MLLALVSEGVRMGFVWAVAGAGVVCIGLALVLINVAIRRRKGRALSILGSVALTLAALVLLACYLPVFVLPEVAAESADFHAPAPVAASATVFYISPADMYGGTPSVPTDTLIAVAARTGAIRWQRTLPGTRSQLAVEGDVAYVATFQSSPARAVMVAAYRGADGALLWQLIVADSFPHAILAASSGTVYFLTGTGIPNQANQQSEIIALSALDGMRLWSVAGPTNIYVLDGMLIATPDAVYLTTLNSLYAYRSSDGGSLWQRTGQFIVAPVVGAGAVYLPLSAGGFVALREDNGAVICQVGKGFDVVSGALEGDTLYLSVLILGPESPPYPSAVYAYDAATCTPRWHVANIGGDLVAGGGVVFVEAVSDVIALRGADGKVLWQRDAPNTTLRGTGWALAARPARLDSTFFATSALLSGGIHILGGDGWIHLYAFNGVDGFEYWNVPVGHHTTFLPHLTY